ncbi:succinylglutamate desuccinylase/aspartoacylase family protein [Legionella genomosp. 1]|uniref:succinylglutamate desuccinylase/aspartoacylase family protein n=1 Tax=Legionella genomosp. 1 TaxID=1093625 RepID=UPI001054B3F5|nr:succinylglutamate desuccinylase/aspartoacylase family protein [Legionella genomosp. 1]
MPDKSFNICDTDIPLGTIKKIIYKFSNLYTQKPLEIPIHVNHGKEVGPRLFILSTIHGDELNGIEIINRFHAHPAYKEISGTVISIPVANPYGLIQCKREIGKKDLNRSFPGSEKGSLASRLACFYTNEIIKICDYGLDLHSGGKRLLNFPHIRICNDAKDSKALASHFGVPVVSTALKANSLRKTAYDHKIPFLVYEAGEASRIDYSAVQTGLQGLLNVLCSLKMISEKWYRKDKEVPFYDKLEWVRAPASGLFLAKDNLNKEIEKDEELGKILDPFDLGPSQSVKSPQTGVIIAKCSSPLVSEGDALFHIAKIK